MGRTKANALPQFFEVRIRNNHVITGIQVEASSARGAAKRIHGHIISVRKIQADVIMGNIERMDLKQLNGTIPAEPMLYDEGFTLDSVLFGTRKKA
jgi:hypothetical protein